MVHKEVQKSKEKGGNTTGFFLLLRKNRVGLLISAGGKQGFIIIIYHTC